MKKTLLIITICFTALNSLGQTPEVSFDQPRSFYKTPPLRDLLRTIQPVNDSIIHLSDAPKPIKTFRYGDTTLLDHSVYKEDDAIQTEQGNRSDRGYRWSLNIDGQFGAFPPDPTGAAGANYYVQAVNSTFRVFTKDGDPETPPYPLNTLWDRSGNGDPIVMYDRFAERWFISQFYFNDVSEEYGLLIAISVTSDPLGEYYTYDYDFALFPDYPKYAVWSNAYFMSGNSSSADCCAFEREKMLVGDPTAGVIKMTFPSLYLQFNSLAPAYAEGYVEPDSDEPGYFFAVQDNSYPGVSTDHIKILKADINWDSPGTSTVSIHQELNTASFNSVFGGGWTENITQKGTSQRLDAIPGIFMYRAQYRRFDGYNTIMLCHNVNVGGSRAGMRWYELRDNNDGVWNIHQQGTYAPSDGNSRWLGNLAMDAHGNIAMAYSFTGSDDYAGIRYTGRFADDPLNEMTVPEQIAVEGEGAQTGGGRFGDYSQMTMDPSDDMTFWYTGEYLGAGGSRKTRILALSTWYFLGTEEEKPAIFNAFQPYPNQLQLDWSNLKDEDIVVSVLNIDGKEIINKQIKSSTTDRLVHLPNNLSGIFIVRLIGENTNLNKKIYLGN
ncbi:T9SS type A sorting domain-containing protein [Crocinitomix algicola]|uniref:T9SS type A sorting domain-containing protein n=1 Tax=Crocinitomix algicola TaxID=1740263 RepID=UPI00082FCA5D|nr:T9SS type A sorting domain-containing protein [Crocinitomix algicola]